MRPVSPVAPALGTEVIIKVQAPNTNAPQQPWLFYDGPLQTLRGAIPADTPGLAQARRALQERGISRNGMALAFLRARAEDEGRRMRVFLDRFEADWSKQATLRDERGLLPHHAAANREAGIAALSSAGRAQPMRQQVPLRQTARKSTGRFR